MTKRLIARQLRTKLKRSNHYVVVLVVLVLVLVGVVGVAARYAVSEQATHTEAEHETTTQQDKGICIMHGRCIIVVVVLAALMLVMALLLLALVLMVCCVLMVSVMLLFLLLINVLCVLAAAVVVTVVVVVVVVSVVVVVVVVAVTAGVAAVVVYVDVVGGVAVPVVVGAPTPLGVEACRSSVASQQSPHIYPFKEILGRGLPLPTLPSASARSVVGWLPGINETPV